MSMFGKSSTKTIDKSNANSTTIITECMNIEGNIKGCGAIHIDGTIHGNLNIEDSIVIGATGSVYGNIKSNKITISGKLKGEIICDTLEVSQTGNVSHSIDARSLICDGKIDADIKIEEVVHITENGRVTTENLISKLIIANGHIDGTLTATELLEISENGQVKGEMIVKKIKVSEGGLMLGSMQTYFASDSVKIVKNKIENKNKTLEENKNKVK